MTEYVRVHVAKLERGGMTKKEIADQVRCSPSTITQLASTGVGGRSIDGFARLLGFSSEKALRRAAYEWYAAEQPKTAARAQESAVIAAAEKLKTLQPWVTDEQITTILHRFNHEDFAGRDESYWLVTLGAEIAQDTLRAKREKVERETAAAAKRQAAKKAVEKQQAVFRTGHNLRAKAAEEAAVAATEGAVEATNAAAAPPDAPPESEVAQTNTDVRPTAKRRKAQ